MRELRSMLLPSSQSRPRRLPLSVGLDCRWKPSCRRWTTTSKVPILQLCAGTPYLFLQLCATPSTEHMGCPRERASVAIVFMVLLFLLAGQAGVVSCHPSPTVAVKHQAAHARKLLNNTSAAGGNSRGAAAVAYAASADLCSEEVVEVFQGNAGSLPNGIPSYSVTITNTCLDCTVCDVHVSCGEFASTELVDPSDFRRLSYGDCLVRNGGPIGPGEAISFEYSNSFIYKMGVATVSCVGICSEEVVELFQGKAGSLPNGVPSYGVNITNTCLDCTVYDVHVCYSELAFTELVDPNDF